MADNNFTYDCVGTVLPRMDAGHSRQNINKTTASASSQSFTEQQRRTNQQDIINTIPKLLRKENLKAEEHQMNGIGLESHFSKLKFPLMKAIVDKLATLKLPIKLTETDTGYKFDTETQAIYLEQTLREGFSHPAVDRIMLWTALHPYGFYQTCLTDYNLQNLLAGDVVEKLLKNGKTGR
ncbi:GLYCOSYL HYDROLASE FAMILY 10 PROTEIN [Salix purpurea]|uniref:GLYCOSYL HYDROLASE FAMILY 10 PROTEIN n=1 Tax=Salix purpurea TaxID=77065 RepID=A0A9Q0PQZ7_SALPP|nr:GLYCOSYL HYDROLASE FAMILY 10 PROTEIN [Salix purpurea]